MAASAYENRQPQALEGASLPPLLPTHNTNLQSQLFPICFQRDRISKSSSSESKNLSNLSASEESAREKESVTSVGHTDCSAAVGRQNWLSGAHRLQETL